MGDRGRIGTAERPSGPTRGRSRVAADLAQVRHRWPEALALWLGLVGLVVAGAAGVGGLDLATELGDAGSGLAAGDERGGLDTGGERSGGDATGGVLLAIVLATLLVPVVLIDLAVRLIPNWLTGAGALAALALGLATDPSAVPERLLACSAAGGFLLVAALLRPGGLGMGDVKLAGVLGLFLGASVAVALVLALVLAALAGGAVLARDARARREAARPSASGGRARLPAAMRADASGAATLPLGPSLALGAIVALLYGPMLLDAYLG